MNSDPTYSRKIDYFVTDIQNICNLVNGTCMIFLNYPQSDPTTHSSIVDASLFILILSYMEGYMKDLIKPHTSRGCEALMMLQRHWSQITPTDIHRVQWNILLIKQQWTETAPSYICRLCSAICKAEHLGIKHVDEFSIVDTCLEGFSNHRLYKASIQHLKSQKRHEDPLGYVK